MTHLTMIVLVVARGDEQRQGAGLQFYASKVIRLTQRTTIVDTAFTTEVSFEGSLIQASFEEVFVVISFESLNHGAEDSLSFVGFVVVYLPCTSEFGCSDSL